MIEINFNTTPYGKTYYSTNKEWKYLKRRIKDILDEKESCKEHKINLIISLLEHYKNIYLRGDDHEK